MCDQECIGMASSNRPGPRGTIFPSTVCMELAVDEAHLNWANRLEGKSMLELKDHPLDLSAIGTRYDHARPSRICVAGYPSALSRRNNRKGAAIASIQLRRLRPGDVFG